MLSFIALGIIYSAFSISSVAAQSLLGRHIQEAPMHDFISYFEFKPDKTITDGELTIYQLTSQSVSALLELGIDKQGAIKQMKLTMPRNLIDDLKETIGGRDLAKSFLKASAQSAQDLAKLEPLLDEVQVRDLDLQPVQIAAKKFEDTGNPVPRSGFKIGKGPLQAGDRLVFLPQLPTLQSSPSGMYEVFAGRKKSAQEILPDSRLTFENQSKDQPVLICESWDDYYWLSKLGPKAQAAATPAEVTVALKQAATLESKKDFAGIVALLKPLAAKYSTNFDCNLELATALVNSGSSKEAIPLLRSLIRQERQENRRSAKLHLMYAQALSDTGEVLFAFEEGAKARDLAPKDAELLTRYGEILVQSKNPVLCSSALKVFQSAKDAGSTDYRLPALTSVAEILMGREAKGLAHLRDSIRSIPLNNSSKEFVKGMENIADQVQRKIESKPPAPVALKDRKYEMKPNVSCVIADRSEDGSIVTVKVADGHDPDGGAQDGTDDGIIELLWDNLQKPDRTYRPR